MVIFVRSKMTRIEQRCYIGITVEEGRHILQTSASQISRFHLRSTRSALLAAHPPIFFKYRCENVVQRSAESPEGDGPTHQPDIPLPAKSLARAGLAVRERESADRGTHCRLRRVHELGVGRRRGVPSKNEEQEAARPDHAEGRQYHADTKHQPHGELRRN